MQSFEEHREEYTHTLNGDGSITFFYRPPARLINKMAELDCPDLYERMFDDNGNQKEFEYVPESHEYFLRIDNVPSDTFATYRIKVRDIVPPGSLEEPHERIVPPSANQPIVVMNHLNLYTETLRDLETKPASIVQEQSAYIITGTAKIPPYFQPTSSEERAPPILNGTVEHDTFKSSSQLERDIWIYKPNGFDERIPHENRKVIFMLDGKDFCEKLTPSIDAISEPFSNTAIVFIDPGKYQPPPPPAHEPPDRVRDNYFETERFSQMLGDELLPKYCHELKISNKDNVILSAHSLAAYPMIRVAEKYPNQIGGLFLFSPALNQKAEPTLPINPDPTLKDIPIFMQIGEGEDCTPPQSHQDTREMQNKSRLQATEEFHNALVSGGFNVQPSLRVHPYGHDSVHVFEGMIEGMKFQQSRLGARNTMVFKHLLNEQRAAANPVKSVDETVQQGQANIPTPRPGSS